MKLTSVLIVLGIVLLALMVIVPVSAANGKHNDTEPTVTTEIPTTEPTPTITPVPTVTAVQEEIIHIKNGALKDRSPKMSGNKLVFDSATVPVKVVDANDKKTIIQNAIVDNQIEIPAGRVAMKIEVGDTVYIIRRNV